MIKAVSKKEKNKFDELAKHPLQSYEWGDFRSKTGLEVVRYGIYEKNKLLEPIQVTIHPIGVGRLNIGYFPKGYIPTASQTKALGMIAKDKRCIFIKVEPKVESAHVNKQRRAFLKRNKYVKGRPLFTKYNFVLDLDKSEKELLANMKSKTRYNIRLAKRKGVKVSVDNSERAFEKYLELTKETTDRQGFYSHDESYHRKMWKTLAKAGKAIIIKAEYEGEIITTWVLFSHGNTMYYPYGASSRKWREVMANNLVMWEAIRLAKNEGYKYFDMWGALGKNPQKSDPWYGFHRFKEGYGARHVEYMGSYDFVNMELLYPLYRIAEKVRWWVLKRVKK